MDALAEAAGMTHGSQYSQFDSKEHFAGEALGRTSVPVPPTMARLKLFPRMSNAIGPRAIPTLPERVVPLRPRSRQAKQRPPQRGSRDVDRPGLLGARRGEGQPRARRVLDPDARLGRRGLW